MDAGFRTRLRLLGALASAVLGSACGSGEGDTTSTEVSVEGSWSGTYAPPGATHPRPVFAMVVKGGTAFFYDVDGIVYRMPRLDGAYTFSGTVQAIAPIGYQFGPSAPDPDYSIHGAAADSEITGELRNDSGTGQLHLLPFDVFPKRPAVTEGQWAGYYITPSPNFVGLTVGPQGRISGDDAFGCHLTGHVRQRDGENLFDVTLVTTGPRPICGETFAGLAHEADYDTFGYFKQQPGTYYYLGVMSASRAFAAEFKVD